MDLSTYFVALLWQPYAAIEVLNLMIREQLIGHCHIVVASIGIQDWKSQLLPGAILWQEQA